MARLGGAVTLPAYRGRGLHTAIVAARCRLARAHDATLGLTPARQDTSAPILERLGFVPSPWNAAGFFPPPCTTAAHQPETNDT